MVGRAESRLSPSIPAMVVEGLDGSVQVGELTAPLTRGAAPERGQVGLDLVQGGLELPGAAWSCLASSFSA